MSVALPNTLQAIIDKVRKITGRAKDNQITDQEIVQYVNTFYVYDMPEHLRMESLRYNFQFTTQPNVPTYDFPTGTYLTNMPPVFIGGYQSFMTQSRENFFRINPQLNYLQASVYTGNNNSGPYTGQFLNATPIIPGFKPNPPGAFAANSEGLLPARDINWNVLVSADLTPNSTSGLTPSINLIDDGLGHLINVEDPGTRPSTGFNYCGSINYITGAIDITNFRDAAGANVTIPTGSAINVQYIPYVASRPQSVVFYQDQFLLYPVPDQAYTVSFEAYKYPAYFRFDTNGNIIGTLQPQLNEWWQMLAYGASDKIFSDNADFESMQKFRPLLKEQMDLALRRTIVQQTSERTATIYTEQSAFPQYPFGNLFSGF